MNSRLKEAIALLRQGDWQAAHDIVQEDTSEMGSFLHGLVHRLEGDEANAAYWFRRAGELGRELKGLPMNEALDAAEAKL